MECVFPYVDEQVIEKTSGGCGGQCVFLHAPILLALSSPLTENAMLRDCCTCGFDNDNDDDDDTNAQKKVRKTTDARQAPPHTRCSPYFFPAPPSPPPTLFGLVCKNS